MEILESLLCGTRLHYSPTSSLYSFTFLNLYPSNLVTILLTVGLPVVPSMTGVNSLMPSGQI